MKTNKEAKELLADLVRPLVKEIEIATAEQRALRNYSIPLEQVVVLKQFAMDLGIFRTENAYYDWFNAL